MVFFYRAVSLVVTDCSKHQHVIFTSAMIAFCFFYVCIYIIYVQVYDGELAMWTWSYIKRWMQNWITCGLLFVYLITCILLLHSLLFHAAPSLQSRAISQTQSSSIFTRLSGVVPKDYNHVTLKQVKIFFVVPKEALHQPRQVFF